MRLSRIRSGRAWRWYRDRDLALHLDALDTEAHARQIGEDAYVEPNEHVSADCSLYVRCGAVAKGRQVFKTVLNNPWDRQGHGVRSSSLSGGDRYERMNAHPPRCPPGSTSGRNELGVVVVP